MSTVSKEVDATAAAGIIQRVVLAKTRRIEVQDLWLQENAKSKKVKLAKIPGPRNIADIGTNALSAEAIAASLKRVGFTDVYESCVIFLLGELLFDSAFYCSAEGAAELIHTQSPFTSPCEICA